MSYDLFGNAEKRRKNDYMGKKVQKMEIIGKRGHPKKKSGR